MLRGPVEHATLRSTDQSISDNPPQDKAFGTRSEQ